MLILLFAACDLLSYDCSLMYVPNSFTLKLDVAAEGAWSWTIDSGTSHAECSVTLPDAQEAVCTGDVRGSADVTATADGWELLTSFTPAGDAQDVDVVVSLDGVEVGSQTFTPDWNEAEPNGEGCGTQISGAGEMDLTGIE